VSAPDGPESDAPEAPARDAASDPAPVSVPEPGPVATVRYGRRRRAPRYGSFLVTGAILGIAIGIALSVIQSMRDSDPSQFSLNTVLGYVAATLGLVGALLGAGLAVLLDRRANPSPGPVEGESSDQSDGDRQVP
jgi:F0F1-type ATP synthase assembly protein I